MDSPSADDYVKYILAHGHKACVTTINNIVKISATSVQSPSLPDMDPEIIDADYRAVRDWLGY